MQHLEVVWYLLAAASAGVFLHAGIKFPWFVFFQKDSGLRPDDPPLEHAGRHDLVRGALHRHRRRAGAALRHAAVSGRLTCPTPRATSSSHLQLLLFSGLAFFLMLGWLKRTLTITLDVDWLYRRLGPALAAQPGPVGRGRVERRRERGRRAARAGSSARSSDITDPTAFSPAPGRPAAWRFGRPSCWPPIWCCRICDRERDVGLRSPVNPQRSHAARPAPRPSQEAR